MQGPLPESALVDLHLLALPRMRWVSALRGGLAVGLRIGADGTVGPEELVLYGLDPLRCSGEQTISLRRAGLASDKSVTRESNPLPLIGSQRCHHQHL